jgi:hypothetical protein
MGVTGREPARTAVFGDFILINHWLTAFRQEVFNQSKEGRDGRNLPRMGSKTEKADFSLI